VTDAYPTNELAFYWRFDAAPVEMTRVSLAEYSITNITSIQCTPTVAGKCPTFFRSLCYSLSRHACMFACNVCMHVWMNVCMNVCMYVFRYKFMYLRRPFVLSSFSTIHMSLFCVFHYSVTFLIGIQMPVKSLQSVSSDGNFYYYLWYFFCSLRVLKFFILSIIFVFCFFSLIKLCVSFRP